MSSDYSGNYSSIMTPLQIKEQHQNVGLILKTLIYLFCLFDRDKAGQHSTPSTLYKQVDNTDVLHATIIAFGSFQLLSLVRLLVNNRKGK